MKLLVLWLCVLGGWTLIQGLKLAAFNIQCFGMKKANDSVKMDHIAKIVWRYDIILIQEVRQEEAIDRLIALVQSKHGVTLTKQISDKRGPGTHKEQYAYLYRNDKQISVQTDAIDESKWKNKFQRSPYIVRFQDKNGLASDITLVGLHTKPTETVRELQALTTVWTEIESQWQTDDILIMGDLNAGGNYVTKVDWQNIPIHDANKYLWPIDDNTLTMVKSTPKKPTKTERAYDRFIMERRTNIANAVVPNSGRVYNFTMSLGLTEEEALAVSDHFPIELELKSIQPSAKKPKVCHKPQG